MLSPVLAGEKQLPDIMTHPPEWFEANDIHFHPGVEIVNIDRNHKVVIDTEGRSTPYDVLIIATGSNPFIIPVPGHDLPGVVSFRDIRDVDIMIEAAGKHPRAAVIGGGLLGLEAAYGLIKRGMDVTVVHLMDTLLERQLDKTAAELLRADLEAKGFKFAMPKQTVEILGNERATGLKFADGDVMEADLVVMAVGIRPNVELGNKAGLDVNRGIIVNDQMQTSDSNIYALGECIEFDGQTFGLVAPLYEQAEVLAKVLAGQDAYYQISETATMLKVTGINLFSAGDYTGEAEGSESITWQDHKTGAYRKLVLNNGRISGAVMYGDTHDSHFIFELIKTKKDISHCRPNILFGQGYCEL
jgi:nitrite reductase (NADH) large subunit